MTIDLFAAVEPVDKHALVTAYQEAHDTWTKSKNGETLAAKYAAMDALIAAGLIGVANKQDVRAYARDAKALALKAEKDAKTAERKRERKPTPRKEKKVSQEPCPTSCPEACPNHSQLDLFGEFEQVVTDDGEVVTVETPKDAGTAQPDIEQPGAEPTSGSFVGLTDEEKMEIAKRLGFGGIRVEDRGMADWVLKRRMAAVMELELITGEYQKAKRQLESDITSLDLIFGGELEAWARQNLAAGKKGIKLLHGELKFRDQSDSVSMDAESARDFEQWLSSRPDEFKHTFNIHPVTHWAADNEGIKAWYRDAVRSHIAEGKPVPILRGLLYKPAQSNKFSVSPSLDTIKKRIREATAVMLEEE